MKKEMKKRSLLNSFLLSRLTIARKKTDNKQTIKERVVFRSKDLLRIVVGRSFGLLYDATRTAASRPGCNSRYR